MPKTVAPIIMSETMLDSPDPGIRIYVRNKRLANITAFSPDRTILFVHGSTYPAETTFDLPINGQSWMDYLASHGYDVYLVDLRGYGRSTRPAIMDEPPENNAPIVRTTDAVRDVSTAVDYILHTRGIEKINLIGWSWGCTIMASFTAQNVQKVNRLVLYAPQWIRSTAPPDSGKSLGAYRTLTAGDMITLWLAGVAEEKKAGLIPEGVAEQWVKANLMSDPEGARQTPPILRAPNGTVQDTREIWSHGKTVYDPAKIAVPVLITVADWDSNNPPSLSRTLFSLLVNSPYRRLVEIGEGTHTLMLERNRWQLFHEVQLFLDEKFLPQNA